MQDANKFDRQDLMILGSCQDTVVEVFYFFPLKYF